MARYDVEKKCAIEKENYDLAKTKKELMDEYRKSVYQQLEVHNLLDMTMVSLKQLIMLQLHSRHQWIVMGNKVFKVSINDSVSFMASSDHQDLKRVLSPTSSTSSAFSC